MIHTGDLARCMHQYNMNRHKENLREGTMERIERNLVAAARDLVTQADRQEIHNSVVDASIRPRKPCSWKSWSGVV